MTQSERTAYQNAFAVGMTIGINARKEPFRILSAAKHTELVTGDTPVIEATVPVYIAESESIITGDTPGLYATTPVSVADSASITTGNTPGVNLGVPVSFGTSIFLEEI